MPQPGAQKLNLPRLRELTLRRFSLYAKRKDELKVEFTDGVFCLAGANGLGKSTFLNALNFGLTGRVPSSETTFASDDEYYSDSKSFVASYFSGRIQERDRKAAEVSIVMDVGARTYRITRGVFDADSLRELTIARREGAKRKQTVELDTAKLSAAKRDVKYQEAIVHDIGLSTFSQFVFLQHFVLTFDERRHLLFWSPKELETALYLAFGLDFAEATMAGTLRREMEKADSLVRNMKWNETQLEKRIKELRDNSQSEADSETRKKYDALLRQSEAATAATRKIETQLREQTVTLTDLATKQVVVKSEHEELFYGRLRNRVSLRNHPLIVASNEQEKCGLCGAEGHASVSALNARVSASQCPLCESSVHIVSGTKDKENFDKLQELDRTLMEIGAQIQEAVRAANRLKGELTRTQEKERVSLEKIEKFEQKNLEVASSLKKGADTSMQQLIESFEKRKREMQERREAEIARREKNKKALKQLRGKLVEKYRLAEKQFLPVFLKLAKEFLGLDLNVQIQESGSASVGLIIKVRTSARLSPYELSESQRLFVDIALRMALAQHISTAAGKATLFIDTPEGSLDIAYENRAGSMMADFALAGHPVIMTANINTSRLLQHLAERLRSEHMVLCRMTSWAELSQVQVAEERLFNDAYKQIEKRLQGRTRAS